MYKYKFVVDDGARGKDFKWMECLTLLVAYPLKEDGCFAGCLCEWLGQCGRRQSEWRKRVTTCRTFLLAMGNDEEN